MLVRIHRLKVREVGFSIYSALVWSKSIIAIYNGEGGVLPQKIFGLNGVKSCNQEGGGGLGPLVPISGSAHEKVRVKATMH